MSETAVEPMNKHLSSQLSCSNSDEEISACYKPEARSRQSDPTIGMRDGENVHGLSSHYLWMLKATNVRLPVARTFATIEVGGNEALAKSSNEKEKSTEQLKIDTNNFMQRKSLDTAALLDYANFLELARDSLAQGLAPSVEIMRRIAELVKVDRMPNLVAENPSLLTLFQAEVPLQYLQKCILQAGATNEVDSRKALQLMRRRRKLLRELLEKKEEQPFEGQITLSEETRKHAELELRLLRLKELQNAARRKLATFNQRDETKKALSLNRWVSAQAAFMQEELEAKLLTAQSAQSAISLNDELVDITAGIPPAFHRVSIQCNRRLTKVHPSEQVLRLKLDSLLQYLPSHYRKLRRRWEKLRESVKQVTIEAKKRIGAILQRKEVLRERERKERMKLLKEHDFDKYLELVKHSKNARIQELLNQTDRFLESVMHKVHLQQCETSRAKEAQKQLTTSVKESCADNADETAQSSPSTHSEAQLKTVEHEVSERRRESLGSSLYHAVARQELNETVLQPSLLVGGKLMPYQLSGLQFLINLYLTNLSGILADEMGLGKTIQTIALLAYLKELKTVEGPHLIIVPLSTLPNWMSEFEKWCPVLNVIEYRGNRQERKVLARSVKSGDFNVCVTTYDWIIREKSTLSIPHWGYIIVDEGHRMKNVKSKFHVTLSDFRSTHRLLLTGTPLQNNLSELWALLNFLLPRIFSSVTDFELWFEEPFKNFPGQEVAELTDEEKFLIINRLHSVLRPFLLRRVKQDVLQDLPSKREYIVRVQLSAWQKQAYENLSNKAMRMQNVQGKVSYRSFANVMMQLRKIVNHPYLFEDEYFINQDLYRTSGKFEVLDRMLPKLIHFKHKTLIFCQMTQLMDILDDYLEFKQYKHCRLDGSTLLDDRKDRTTTFNDPTSEMLIFTLSTRSGGLGLNLQAADTVIIFDSDWNPHQDLQAQARAHRMGQKNEVRVFKLVTVSGIEEAVLSKAQHKLDIDEKIIQAGMFNNKCNEEERQNRLRTLLYSKDEGLEERVTTPQELNQFMARTEEEEQFFRAYDENLFGIEAYRTFEERCPIPMRPKGTDQVSDLVDSPSVDSSSDMFQVERIFQTSRATRAATRRAKLETLKKLEDDSRLDSPLSSLSLPRSPSNVKAELHETKRKKKQTIKKNPQMIKNKAQEVACREESTDISSMISGIMGITEETFLIKSNRLMSYDEIPDTWISAEVDSPAGELERTDRKSRSSQHRMTAECLSEAAFARALRRLENGEAKDLETAISLEKSLIDSKRGPKDTKRPRDEPYTDSGNEDQVLTRSKRRKTSPAMSQPSRESKDNEVGPARGRFSSATELKEEFSVKKFGLATKKDERSQATGPKACAQTPTRVRTRFAERFRSQDKTFTRQISSRRNKKDNFTPSRARDCKQKNSTEPKGTEASIAGQDVKSKSNSNLRNDTTLSLKRKSFVAPSSRLRRRALTIIDDHSKKEN